MRRIIASWFGSGLIVPALRGGDALGSGTVGAFVALLMVWAMSGMGWVAQTAAAVFLVLLSLWSAKPFSSDGSDPGWIVVDEVAGMFVAGIGLSGWPLLVAFVVFRIADITKRFPGVAAAERLHGALGVTADDVVAGLWALAAGWLFAVWF